MTGIHRIVRSGIFAAAVIAAQPAFADFALFVYARHPAITEELKRAGVRARLYRVVTGDMEPLISEGDILVGDQREAGRLPRRGETIAFLGPEDRAYIKRAVGLPGDTIAFEGPRMLLNGRLTTPGEWPGEGKGHEIAVEALPGVPGAGHLVLCRGADAVPVSMPVITVPADRVFVAGDNRCSSVDSRHFGPVPRKAILARLVVRLEPEETWLGELGSLVP